MTLLTAAAATRQTPISSLPLMTGAERRCSWTAGTRRRRPMTGAACISSSPIRPRGSRGISPWSTAPVRLTYAELDRRSNQLAHELLARGVEPGELVGICLDRSAELVALMAVLKTGAAYVPIEPTYPPQRQEYMLADARAPVLITQERHSSVVDARDFQVVWIDRAGDGGADRCAARRPRRRHTQRSGAACLRDLHLRLDRPAKGGGDHTPFGCQPARADCGLHPVSPSATCSRT